MGWGWVRIELHTLDGWPPRRDATTIALRRQWPRHGCGWTSADQCDRSRSQTRGPCRACNGASVRFIRDAEDEPSWAPRFLDLVRRRPAMRERSMRDKMSGCEHVHRAGKGKWARGTCCADQNYEAYHLPQYLRRQSWLSTVAPSLLCSDWMD